MKKMMNLLSNRNSPSQEEPGHKEPGNCSESDILACPVSPPRSQLDAGEQDGCGKDGQTTGPSSPTSVVAFRVLALPRMPRRFVWRGRDFGEGKKASTKESNDDKALEDDDSLCFSTSDAGSLRLCSRLDDLVGLQFVDEEDEDDQVLKQGKL